MFFIGEIVETYADERVLKGGKIDLTQLKPLLFDMSSVQYFALGNPLGGAWKTGKQMKK